MRRSRHIETKPKNNELQRILRDFLLNNPFGIRTQVGLAEYTGVSQSLISRILSNSRTDIKTITLQKFAAKMPEVEKTYHKILPTACMSGSYHRVWTNATRTATYIKIEPTNVRGVYAYYLSSGLTYIGKPREKRLEDACVIPTAEIATMCLDRQLSAVDIARRLYTRLMKGGALGSFDHFSPLESAAATQYLGYVKEK